MPNMVMPPSEQHDVGGGLRFLSAFLVYELSPFRPVHRKSVQGANILVAPVH